MNGKVRTITKRSYGFHGPWSLMPAVPCAVVVVSPDDPACKDPGWRTTIQVIAPWIRVATPELRVEALPMIARVKWSDKRVCLEGVEVKLPT